MVNNFQLRIETDAGLTEVNQGAPETMIDKLNRLAKECGFDNISTDAIHIIRDIDQPTGITHLFNRTQEEAFVLSNLVATRIAKYRNNGRVQIPEEYRGGVAVKRICVGYSALSRINTAVDMQRVMGPLINEAVKDFIDEFGFISLGYKITALQQGSETNYFRDIDNIAGMEFRLVLLKGV